MQGLCKPQEMASCIAAYEPMHLRWANGYTVDTVVRTGYWSHPTWSSCCSAFQAKLSNRLFYVLGWQPLSLSIRRWCSPLFRRRGHGDMTV